MITVTEEPESFNSGARVYIVRVPYADLVSIELDPIDRAVLNAPMNTAADVLQNLQTLAFRQQQQSKVTL